MKRWFIWLTMKIWAPAPFTPTNRNVRIEWSSDKSGQRYWRVETESAHPAAVSACTYYHEEDLKAIYEKLKEIFR